MHKDTKKIKYQSHTLGNSPAAIYLIDVINSSDNPKDHRIISHINDFKRMFKQITNAHDKGMLDNKTVYSFIIGKTLELEQKSEYFLKNNYSLLVVNLFRNLIMADMKSFNRTTTKQNCIEKSAISRAKDLLKKEDKKINHTTITTYGKINSDKPEIIDTVVVFNEHGIPRVEIDKNSIKDDITNETLLGKSIARLTRLGRYPFNK